MTPAIVIALKLKQEFEIKHGKSPQDYYCNEDHYGGLAKYLCKEGHNMKVLGMNVWPVLSEDQSCKCK
jgi:hypothetical protein